MIRLNRKNKYSLTFFAALIILGLTLIACVVFLLVTKGSIKDGIDFTSYYALSDMGQLLGYALAENPYTEGYSTMYLPLCFLLIKPFALICAGRNEFSVISEIDVDSPQKYQQILQYNYGVLHTPQFWIAAVSFYLIFITLCGIVLYKIVKWENRNNFILFYLAVVMSGPFAFGIFRGTNLFQGLLFVLLFLWLYRSPVKWQREIALVCLATAGVLKLYPLLFGALLLKEKRFFESVRVAVYFFILAILPFAFYENPLSTMKAYLINIVDFANSSDRINDTSSLSVYSFFTFIFSVFRIEGTSFARFFCIGATVLTFALSVTVAIGSKSALKRFTAICCGIIAVPQVSYFYVLIFTVIPLFALIEEWNGLTVKEKVLYALFYIACILPFVALRFYVVHTAITLTLLIIETIALVKRKSVNKIKNT